MVQWCCVQKYLDVPFPWKTKFPQQLNITGHSFLPLEYNPLPITYQKRYKHILSSSAMDTEVAYDLSPVLKVYKNGRIERLVGVEVVPPSLDPQTNVQSKDVVISEQDGVSARLYIPKATYPPPRKLPLLVYFHGGAFCVETPFSPNYHNLLNNVVSKASAVAVSVHYRRAPEHPVPAGHHDSWRALQWVASHVAGKGPEEWLNRHADFERVFLAGDSAGANITSYLGVRVGMEGLPGGATVEGIVLVHPFFWGEEPIGSEANQPEQVKKIRDLLRFACPPAGGLDNPIINPEKDPNVGKLGCKRLLVCLAEKDLVRDRGWHYHELLQKNGWPGIAQVLEIKDEDHAFHLFKPNSENTQLLIHQMVSFIQHGYN
ncbi:hypothetical protein Fmac_006120 [Flemingia macrophylla]|uniref:Alpha/beta hydrolase fold-3 domain-containing protein n=1 Tax=Flemingia macrophylla TaxID=520843 RepID=A0ABD1N9S9_9FABA